MWLSTPLLIKGSHSDLATSFSNYVYFLCSYLQSKLKFFYDFFIACKWRKPGIFISQNLFTFFPLPFIAQSKSTPWHTSYCFYLCFPQAFRKHFQFLCYGNDQRLSLCLSSPFQSSGVPGFQHGLLQGSEMLPV